MFAGLFSFFGGTAFRWLVGEVVGFFKAKQEHEHEMALMQLNFSQDKERHQWQQEAIAAQAAAGVKVLEAQAEATARGAADQMMLTAMEQIGRPSGVAWIDGFNAFIRPELAQVSIFLLAGHAIWPDVVRLEGVVLEVVCAVLGLFVGGRIQTTGR